MFVDESGFNTSMARLRARAPRGERAYGKVPRNRGKNQTLIASITLEGGMGESVAVEGATDAEAFEAYVEQFLAPTLGEGQVVVLDRLGAHRTQRVEELIEARRPGHEAEVLEALREASRHNPLLRELPPEEATRQLMLEGLLREEPSSELIAEMMLELEVEEEEFDPDVQPGES